MTRLIEATVVCSMLLTTAGHQAQGQTIVAATVTEILDSSQVYIQNRTAQVNSVAQQRQQVRTRSARASLRFNTGAIARLAHNSSLVVGQCAQINRGTLLVNGTLNGCSTSTVAGVRGTVYTIEVTETGETIIQVFEGEVVVERNLDPEPVDPIIDDFDPLDPAFDPVVPATDPVVPFVNPTEPASPPPELPPPASPEPNLPGIEDPQPTDPADPDLMGTNLSRWVAANKQQAAPVVDDVEVDPGIADADGETVDFTTADAISVAAGQQLVVEEQNDQAVISSLSPEDFIRLLEGPLISGFAVEIPGMSNLRRSFQQLFPGVPLPSFWVPVIPRPPIRFPFPF